MKLYEANFSFEVDQMYSTYSILFGTLAEAKKRSLQLLRDHMDKIQKTSKDLNTGYVPEAVYVQIAAVETVKITKSAFIDIINSSGGSWLDSSTPLLKITLLPDKKRPVTEKLLGPEPVAG